MHDVFRKSAVAAAFLVCAMPAFAQDAPKPSGTVAPAPTAAPPEGLAAHAPVSHVPVSNTQGDPPPTQEALDLAKTLVEKMGVGGTSALLGMNKPAYNIVKAFGVTQPAHLSLIMRDVVTPIMLDHADDFTDLMVKTYAIVLDIPTMKAAIAFYDTPAGTMLAQRRFALFNRSSMAINALMEKIKPEIEAETTKSLKEHGWSKG